MNRCTVPDAVQDTSCQIGSVERSAQLILGHLVATFVCPNSCQIPVAHCYPGTRKSNCVWRSRCVVHHGDGSSPGAGSGGFSCHRNSTVRSHIEACTTTIGLGKVTACSDIADRKRSRSSIGEGDRSRSALRLNVLIAERESRRRNQRLGNTGCLDAATG